MSDTDNKAFLKHMKNGANALLPFVIISGFLYVLSYLFGVNPNNNQGYYFGPSGVLANGASLAVSFMIPILSGFIAISINQRSFASGFIGGIFASSLGTGFLGGIAAGFFAGYLTIWLNKYIKLPQNFDSFKNAVIIPSVVSLITIFFINYVLGNISSFIYTNAYSWVKNATSVSPVLGGLLMGIFIPLDLGGPFTSAVLDTAKYYASAGIFAPQAAVLAIAMAIPLGFALSTLLAKDKFGNEDKEAGKMSWAYGIAGIIPTAIPFAASNPLKVIPSLMAGGIVTGVAAMLFDVKANVLAGGLFSISSVAGVAGLLFSIVAGMFVTAAVVRKV